MHSNTVTSWRPREPALSESQLPRAGALTIDRATQYTPPPPVRVIALRASWCMGGRTVTEGETYMVPPDVAASLEFTGKARLA